MIIERKKVNTWMGERGLRTRNNPDSVGRLVGRVYRPMNLT